MPEQSKPNKIIKIISKILYWMFQVVQFILVMCGIQWLSLQYLGIQYQSYCDIVYTVSFLVASFLFIFTHYPTTKREQKMAAKRYQLSEEYFSIYNQNRSVLLSEYDNVAINNAKKKINCNDILFVALILFFIFLQFNDNNVICFISFEAVTILGLGLYNFTKVTMIKFIDNDIIQISKFKKNILIKVSDIQIIDFCDVYIHLKVNNKKMQFNVSSDKDFLDIFKAILSKCNAEIGSGLIMALYMDKCYKENVCEDE